MKLKELRIMENKSQTEMAKKLGLTQGTYSNYENGTTDPSIKKLIEIADEFNVSIDYLVGRPYGNDLGYINEADKNLLKSILLLSETNKYKVATYAVTLLATQN